MKQIKYITDSDIIEFAEKVNEELKELGQVVIDVKFTTGFVIMGRDIPKVHYDYNAFIIYENK
mgnify:FL=1